MAEAKKNNTLKTALTIGISLAIAAFFMWLALRGLDEKNRQGIKNAFVKANYFWIFAAFVFGIMAYWIRAIRWNMFLEPMGYKISNSNALWTLSFGYLMNLTIPRSGEVARATALYGVEKVPVDKSFGTIILERVVDLFFMMLFLLLTAVFKYEALISFYNYLTKQKENTPQQEQGFPWKWLIVGCIGLGAVLFIAFRKKLQQTSIYAKVVNFGKGLVDGLKSIVQIKNKPKFFLYSAGIWTCYYFAAYLICFALPETSSFGFADGFFLITVGTLGMMVPASGGIGAYHLALKLGVMGLFLAWGKDPEAGAEVGLSYAFLSHTLQLFIMLSMGLISIPLLAKARKV